MSNPPLSREAMKQTAFYTALFSLLAHGYRFLNMSFSGDSTLISQAEEVAYQTAIGRYLQPVLWQIRGTITAPLTIGLFATAALIGAALMIVSLLGLKTRAQIMLTCGILATNETLSVSYATYLPWVDVYMIAFFFAMLGVYVSARWRHGIWLSPVFYMISLGLYQSYLQTAVVMIILLLMQRLFDGERPGVIWLDGVKACLALLAGLLLYAAGLKLVLRAMGLKALNDYNGVSHVGVMSLSEIPGLLRDTYLYPFAFFARSAQDSVIPPVITAALLLASLPALLIRAKGLSAPARLTLLFLFAVLPLGANFVAFISKGIVHPLMVYAFFFLYIGAIALWNREDSDRFAHRLAGGFLRASRTLCALLLGAALFMNIVTANQLYLRRDLELYSTHAAATRILERIDAVEGYIPGETPVCFVGYLPSSRIGFVRPGFEELSNLQGMKYTYAAAYETATPWYYRMILGYPIRFVGTDILYKTRDTGRILPRFPDEGCCAIIDGVLYVHL